MEIIKCPECDNEVSANDTSCPNCGYQLVSKKKNSVRIIILILVICIVGLGTYFTYSQIQNKIKIENQKKEEKRKEDVKDLKSQMSQAYSDADLDKVEECLDSLSEMGENVSNERLDLEFDRENIDCVVKFYTTLKQVDSSLKSGSYSSLRSLVNKMKPVMDNMDKIEVKGNSALAQYIRNETSNIMYSSFYDQYIKSKEYDLDYGLTSDGYAMIIETYTDEMMKVDYPFNN